MYAAFFHLNLACAAFHAGAMWGWSAGFLAWGAGCGAYCLVRIARERVPS